MRSFFQIILILLFCLVSACSTTKSMTSLDESKKQAAKINTQLGMAYFQKHDMYKAKQKLLLALEEDPGLPEAWYSMAYFLENTGNKEEAGKHYLKAIELAPNRGDTQNNLGTYLCRQGDYKASVKHFLLATQDPEYFDTAAAYENAGLCALKIPDKQLAVTCFKKAIEQDDSRYISKNELRKLNV